MFLRVKAYYNRDEHYEPGSITQIVGSVLREFTPGLDLDLDKSVCTAVFALLNGGAPTTGWKSGLVPISTRYYREPLRSMRPGDIITVWTAEREDDCAEERAYEVVFCGFQRVNRQFAEV